MKICVTGSQGLIGFAVTSLLLRERHEVYGIDNNMRAVFFGDEATTNIHTPILTKQPKYHHYTIDIRDTLKIYELFETEQFDAVIHCAAQPSHDKAKEIPVLDFEVNAMGTLNLLEATRRFCPSATFIFTSTNKVYGDRPNSFTCIEKKLRYALPKKYKNGISESCSVDQCLHSLFGASKLAADTYVQEYGKYFGLNTTILRLGCVTGAEHTGVKLHGFLSYLIKSVIRNQQYEIIGYKGKQVRDQIHADDVALCCKEILKRPTKGEVFNMGGGSENSASILELIMLLEKKLGISIRTTYLPNPRIGDHICYITDTSKFQNTFPDWHITKDLNTIIDEIIQHEQTVMQIH